MATRELYERNYEGNIRAELRVYRENFRATVFRPNAPPEFREMHVDWPKYQSAQTQIDVMAGAPTTGDWRRILECPVCESRDVQITRRENRDEFDVTCPRCTEFRLSGVAFVILADVQEGLGGLKARLPDLQYYLQRNVDGPETISSENWLWFVEEGRRLRKQGA